MGDSPTAVLTGALAADARFRQIYEEQFDAVARYFLRRIDRATVPDATSEVFVVVWRRIGDLPPEHELVPWLYGVARNVLRNAQRSQRRRSRLDSRIAAGAVEPDAPTPEGVVVEAVQYETLRAALASLRPRDQEVIRLRAFEELTAGQIGVVLGCSEEAAKKRLARALDALRQAVGARQWTHSSRVSGKEGHDG